MANTKRVRGENPEQDREDSIAFEMNYCQHYTPGAIFGGGGQQRTGLCAAGVEVRSTGANFKEWPCIGGHNLPNVLERCPKWLRRTREQGIERHEAFEKVLFNMRVVMPVVAEWRKKLPRGKAEVIECPACKGRLHLSQAASNGHVWGKCETTDCVSWME